MTIRVEPVRSKAEKKAFIELQYRLNAGDPHWVPPLRDEVNGLITPGKNPWFEHAEAELFLAKRDGRDRRTHLRSGRPARAGAYGCGHRSVGHA
jgi:hypothetical protein